MPRAGKNTSVRLKPDVVVFGSVIDACANDGQHRRAIAFLYEMEEKYGVKPNLKCFSAAISACEKAAKWEEAVKRRQSGKKP